MNIRAVKFPLIITLSVSITFGLLTPYLAAQAQTAYLSKQNTAAGEPRKSQWPDTAPPEETKAALVDDSAANLNNSRIPSSALTSVTRDAYTILEASSDDTNRIIVKYKNRENAKPLLSKLALSEVNKIPQMDMEVVEAPVGGNVDQIIAQLEKDPNVLYAEPDIKIYASKASVSSLKSTSEAAVKSVSEASTAAAVASASDLPITPNDSRFGDQWSLLNTGQALNRNLPLEPGLDMGVTKAWNYTQGRSDLIVAVIDTGIDINHPDLKDNIWTNPNEQEDGKDDDGNGFQDDIHGWDFFNNDNTVYDLVDIDLHGTQIAGAIAAAADNGIGIAGVAPKVKIMPVKFMGLTTDWKGEKKVEVVEEGRLSDAISSIQYAENMGARIATLGWAMTQYSQALKDAIDSSSMLFIASAGEVCNVSGCNKGEDDPNSEVNPSYPADFNSDNIISVTALNDDYINKDAIYWKSKYGAKSVDIAAPGTNVLTTFPSSSVGLAAQTDTGKYKAIYNGIGFENFSRPNGWDDNIPTDTDSGIPLRQDAFNRAMDFFKLDQETARILLIQDDQSESHYSLDIDDYTTWYDSYLETYTHLLAASDYRNVDTYTVQHHLGKEFGGLPKDHDFGPTLNELKKYDLVIWFTGEATPIGNHAVVDKEDTVSLTEYLNQGGNLMMTGLGALMGNEDSSFVKDVLHLDYLRMMLADYSLYNENWQRPKGVSGTAYEGAQYPDVFSPQLFTLFAAMPYVISNDPEITKVNLEGTAQEEDFLEYMYNHPEIEPYRYVSGPSIAAANATGVAALLLSQNPSESNEQVKERMMVTGRPLASLQGSTVSGKMVNAYRAFADDNIPGLPVRSQELTGELDSTAKRDNVYYVHLNAGEKLNLALSGDDGTDFDLYVYSPMAEMSTVSSRYGIVAQSENEGTSKESIFYTAVKEGYYYIDVFAYSGAGGYTLDTAAKANTAGDYEDTDPALLFSGPWTSVSNPGFSGGTAKQLDETGYVQFQFTGSEIEWIGFREGNQGEAEVYIDGDKEKGTVSLSSESLLTNQSLYTKSLPYGLHTIKVQWSESNRSKKKGESLYINVDKFVVSGDTVPVPDKGTVTTFEESSPFVQFKGTWKVNVSNSYSGGRTMYSDIAGNYVKLNFIGSKVELVSITGPNRGKATVTIDGKHPTVVDLYSKSYRNRVVVFTSGDLGSGNHMIKIENTGEKNDLSSDTTISIDAFKVTRRK